MTGNDLINSALRLIGALQSGEIPSAAESADALVILNQMLDSWTAVRTLVFAVQRQGPYNLTPGQQTYTLGPGGTFQLSATRPVKIQGYGIINLANPLQPLELPLRELTPYEWQAIPVKSILGALPLSVWDDQGFPFRTLSFYNVPSIPVQVTVYAWVTLASFPDLTTDVSFPPAYLRALRYNLAVDLAPEFNLPVLPNVMETAAKSRGIIEDMNAPMLDLRCDPTLVDPNGGYYDWRSDTNVRR